MNRKTNSTKKYTNLWESSVGAATGFFNAVRSEHKVRQVFFCLVVAIIICSIADVGFFEILLITFSWVASLICEMFNTAMEKALDFACDKEYHPLVKEGKDYAGACTFVSIVFAVILTLLILFRTWKWI